MHRQLFAAVLVLAMAGGCTMKLGKIRAAQGSSPAATQDCAACKKMCDVASDAEESPAAKKACEADCDKSCK